MKTFKTCILLPVSPCGGPVSPAYALTAITTTTSQRPRTLRPPWRPSPTWPQWHPNLGAFGEPAKQILILKDPIKEFSMFRLWCFWMFNVFFVGLKLYFQKEHEITQPLSLAFSPWVPAAQISLHGPLRIGFCLRGSSGYRVSSTHLLTFGTSHLPFGLKSGIFFGQSASSVSRFQRDPSEKSGDVWTRRLVKKG